ncbi:hypothetical protein Bca52824_019492 [Brassica carinata]|uniref:Cathepsin propeptide inhibitor domain-containing protein n=1 Tax=Brassica carinata TaxID=52824 RepID=A0A8X7VS70_BRACI|nr:hypothetical protein Bca52824_019492 [Brassica carinata]
MACTGSKGVCILVLLLFETGVINSKERKPLHMEKFIEVSRKFIEWKKNLNETTREEFQKFEHDDRPAA